MATFSISPLATSLVEYIAELESRVPVWRSGEESPTEAGRHYLVSCATIMGRIEMIAYWNDGLWWDHETHESVIDTVQQWTDIPQPPGGK